MNPTLNPNQDQEGRTALHYAADGDSKARIAEVLVSAGGDVHRSDFSGLTPLHIAHQAGARGVLATLEWAQRNSRGLAASAVGPAIPLSPLQVDVDEGLWSGGARVAAATPPGRAAQSLHGRAPRSPHAGGSTQQAAYSGRQSPGGGGGPASAGGSGKDFSSSASLAHWGTQSYAEQDIVTGRGEVWVARPLGDGGSGVAAHDDWGMRTVAMEPRSPTASRAPTAAMAAIGAASNASYGQARGCTAAERGQCAPQPHAPQRVPGTATDFSNWEEGAGHLPSMVTRPHSRAPGASVMDLTKSVTDDWIVVDSDDEEVAASYRRAPGAGAAGGGEEADVWQERVNQAKDAALQVKMGIANLWKNFAK